MNIYGQCERLVAFQVTHVRSGRRSPWSVSRCFRSTDCTQIAPLFSHRRTAAIQFSLTCATRSKSSRPLSFLCPFFSNRCARTDCIYRMKQRITDEELAVVSLILFPLIHGIPLPIPHSSQMSATALTKQKKTTDRKEGEIGVSGAVRRKRGEGGDGRDSE